MSLRTTLGQILINDALPEDMVNWDRVLDKKGVATLSDELAEKHPDKYREVMKRLSDVGRHAAYTTGGNSFGLEALSTSLAGRRMQLEMRRDMRKLLSDPTLDATARNKAIIDLAERHRSKLVDAVYKESEDEDNPIAAQLRGAGRGNAHNLNSLRGADLLYVDHRGEPIPIPVVRNYSQGLSPAEYFAGAFGARKGVLDLKTATADAGYFCLAAGTLVRMADWSTKPIEQIRFGDRVLGADRRGRTFPTTVTATFANGLKELHSFRFRYGKSRTQVLEIVATQSHRALISQLRRRRCRPDPQLHIELIQDVLPLGDCRRSPVNWAALVPPQGYKNTGGVKAPFAGLIGLLIAEGGLTTQHVGLSCGDAAVLAAARLLAAKHGLAITKKKNAPYEYTIKDLNPLQHTRRGNGQVIAGTFRNRLRKKLRQLGLLNKRAPEKFIPAVVDSWRNRDVAIFLKWLFTGDGGVSASNNTTTPIIELGMTAEPVVRKAQQLLADRFGIYGQICRANTAGRTMNANNGYGDYTANHDTYVLCISDRQSVLRFAHAIGFVDGNKQARLRNLLAQIQAHGRRDQFLFHFLDSTPRGVGETYDIEVDHPEHLFVLANGAIVSNSKQLNQANHRLLVTADDDDGPGDEQRGLPVDTDDADNAGALLSRPAGGYPRNTHLTPKILRELQKNGINKILVRSPTVGGPGDGGVYARDVGWRERGSLAPVGDFVGMTAAQALGEPLTQAQISSKHCLDGNTAVRMADFTVKAIRDIRIGEQVLGANANGETFPVAVVAVFMNGEKECYQTTFRQAFLQDAAEGRELVSTLCHKMLGIKNCSEQHDAQFNNTPRMLQVGVAGKRVAALAPSGLIDDAGLVREPLALLIGALLGDGCYTESVHGCYFKCHDPLLVTHLEESLGELNIKLTQLVGHEGTYYRVSQIAETVTPQCESTGQFTGRYRNPVMRWLHDRNMLHKYAHEKRLPPEVATWDNQSVAQLLGGLFATDGSVFPVAQGSKWGLNFGSTSREMRDQVRQLLELRFGIYGSIAVNPYGGRQRPMHYLDINHGAMRLRFLELIPLHGVKRQRIVALEAEYPASARHAYMKFIRRSQVSVGRRVTYDIQVDHPDHLFVLANGLIVSNSGGVAGAGAGAIGGFKAINALVQVPEEFPGGATHAQLDGRVQSIVAAPQGGHFVHVGSERHYVPANVELSVKNGDEVEAGDVLSTGMPNPGEVVRHKGIGEGRRYFVDIFRKTLKDSGIYGNRRNIELLARGLVNHVRLTDEVGDWSPDDVVPYATLERSWQPRPGSVMVPPSQAVGQYLERPVLHYSVGTRIGKNMLKNLEQFGINQVDAHREPPPFQPEMVRGAANVSHDPDWMTRMMGSYQQRNLLQGTHRGDVSNTAGTSFVPSLAEGKDFGLTGPTKGWESSPLELKSGRVDAPKLLQ